MPIDEPFTAAKIREFAKEYLSAATPKIREQFASMMLGGQPPEFYKGLLAGMGFAVSLRQSDMLQFLPLLTGGLAAYIEEKEIT